MVNITEKNICCLLCKQHEDNQKHVLECMYIQENISSREILDRKVVYEDICSDNNHTKKAITAMFEKCLNLRENLLTEQDLSILRNAGG